MSESEPTLSPETFMVEFADPIGRLVIAWTMLETAMTNYLQVLFHLNDVQTATFVHPLDARAMTDTCRSYFKHNDQYQSNKKLTKDALGILNDIDELRVLRNQIVHGVYGYSDAGHPQLQMINASNRYWAAPLLLTPDYIYDIEKRIQSRAVYIHDAALEASATKTSSHLQGG